MHDEQVEKERSMKSNIVCRFFTMRGWPASHFATIKTEVAGKTAGTTKKLDSTHVNKVILLALRKQTWEIPRFRCFIVGRSPLVVTLGVSNMVWYLDFWGNDSEYVSRSSTNLKP